MGGGLKRDGGGGGERKGGSDISQILIYVEGLTTLAWGHMSQVGPCMQRGADTVHTDPRQGVISYPLMPPLPSSCATTHISESASPTPEIM